MRRLLRGTELELRGSVGRVEMVSFERLCVHTVQRWDEFLEFKIPKG